MSTETIDKWIIEATSNYNDGWTQKHYRDQLQEVYDRLNQLEFILKDNIYYSYNSAILIGLLFYIEKYNV